ncbi:MAG TPA: hypothetical protein VH414_19595 [Lichenihabitans sp.]|nr:hypothetical protein [Lichenihabitans sp.]
MLLPVLALLSASPLFAQEVEDPVLAAVDNRNWPEAPADASASGAHLTMAEQGDVLTFTVPLHCAAWPAGTGATALIMACAKATWPKLDGRVTISLIARRAAVPAARLDPDWAGLPPPHHQYRLQAREALVLGDHMGNVEAYCDNHWFYCTQVRVDGDLFGARTELRFAATTWDGGAAVALGRAIVAASTFGQVGETSILRQASASAADAEPRGVNRTGFGGPPSSP